MRNEHGCRAAVPCRVSLCKDIGKASQGRAAALRRIAIIKRS